MKAQVDLATEPITPCGEAIDFGEFRLMPSTRAMTRSGMPMHLGARALDILIALVARPGEVVSKEELFEIVWPRISVEESNLRVHVAALRKALGDGTSGTRLIVSIPGRGYSFVGQVQKIIEYAPRTATSAPIAPDDRHALPAPLHRLIGRDAIVSEIVDVLSRQRLITIVGAGGIGKTAVALAVAERIAGFYRDGVSLVDLAPLASPDLVAAHLASLLRLPASDRPPLEGIVVHLRTRHLLIVLDNCEHVIEATSKVAEEILRWAPEAHILATSREPLRAMGEWMHRLTPLNVPSGTEILTMTQACQYPAVELLVERVLACQSSSEFNDPDAPVAAELCTRLDGLPLAIELAATRVPLFGLRGVADRLDDRLSFLTKGRRTAVPRHQTLSAMIDWSYETLLDDEKTVWRRLAVFRGPFTLDAACAVALDSARTSVEVINILDGVLEKSLVVADIRGDKIKYRLLESLRLYALGKLTESGEADLINRRHAQFFYRHALSSEGYLAEAPTVEWLAKHRGEIADIREAVDWAFSPAGDPELAVKLIAASAPFWFKLLLVPELESYLKQAVQLAATLSQIDSEVVMRLNVALAHAIFHTRGYRPEVIDCLRKALAIAEQRGDTESQLQVLWSIFGASSVVGDYPVVMSSVDGVYKVLPKAPDPLARPLYHRMAGLGFHLTGDQQRALEHTEKALDHPAVRERIRGHGIFSYDHKITTSSHYTRILWISGLADQATTVIRATIDDALAVDQPFPLSYFLVFGACLAAFWSGDTTAVRGYMSLLRTVASGNAFNVWQMGARIHERVLELLESPEDQSAAARQALIGDPSLTPFQAESLCTINRRLLCARPLADALRGEINWATAEILRVQGEMILDARGATAELDAERLFLQSLDISRHQHALSWELRSATSLARLWHAADKSRQARDLLAEVHGRFTEGFGTRDILAAQQLLQTLG